MPAESPESVRFGEFELDLRTAELRTNGHKSYLQDKPFQVLVLLLERPGQLVSREQLRSRLWPSDTFVDFDQSLNKAVNRLREALQDSTEYPRFVETLPRRGYRFIASVSTGTRPDPVIGAGAAISGMDAHGPSPGLEMKRSTASSAGDVASRERSPLTRVTRKRLAAIVAACLGLATMVTLALQRSKSHTPNFNFEKMEIRKLTDSGLAESAAISRDGRYLVYAVRSREGVGLRVRQLVTHSDVLVLPPDAIDFEGLTFSPDGNYIYFVRTSRKDPGFRYLNVMPILGGPTRLLATDIDSAVSFSPDGRQFVYTRGDPSHNLCEVRIAASDGSGNQVLATVAGVFAGQQPGAAWSPDGRTIAVPFMFQSKQPGFQLDMISTRDGTVRTLYASDFMIGRPLWLPEGDALLVSLQDRSGRGQLWRISYPEGQTRRLTNDLADYGTWADATRDAGTVAAIQSNPVSNLWIAPAAQPSRARQITSAEIPMLEISAAPKGGLVATSGESDLLLMGADGSHVSPIAGIHNASNPAACGPFLVFESSQPGNVGLMRADADGSNPIQLAKGQLFSPACSTDLQFVYYATSAPAKIWRIQIGGGTPTEVASLLRDGIQSRLQVSPDGKSLAYAFEEYAPTPVMKIAIIPLAGGSVRLLQVPGWTYERGCLRWSPDGKSLQSLVTRDGATNVWEQPLTGGEPRQLTRFASGQIFDFNWSEDRSSLLLARGEVSSDVVLLSNFR